MNWNTSPNIDSIKEDKMGLACSMDKEERYNNISLQFLLVNAGTEAVRPITGTAF
jgi:hypothetical protein